MSTEEFKVSGSDVVATVKKIIAEGNARRIIVRNEAGENIVEFPLTVGAVGVLIIPVIAAIGTITALVAKCTIVVEKRDPKPATAAEEPAVGEQRAPAEAASVE